VALTSLLADSQIVSVAEESDGAFAGVEFEPAAKHDHRPWLAIVAGPAAETGADPGRIGQRPLGCGFFCRAVLPSSLAQYASSNGMSSGPRLL